MANTSQAPAGSREVQTSLTEKERAQVQRLFSDPTELPPIFKNWITSWTEQDVALALTQIQGWSDFLNSQTATDATQTSGLASHTTSISTLNSGLATTNTNVAALQSADSTQNSTITTHTSQIAAIQTVDTTQNGRLSVLEAHTIPYIIASKTSSTVVQNTTSETTLCSLVLPANVLSAPGVVELYANGTWMNNITSTNEPWPTFNVYFATTLVATIPLNNTQAPSATLYPWEFYVRLMNLASKSSQEIVTRAILTPNSSGPQDAVTYMRRASSAINTSTSSRAIEVKCVNPTINTPYNCTINSASLTLLAGS